MLSMAYLYKVLERLFRGSYWDSTSFLDIVYSLVLLTLKDLYLSLEDLGSLG